MGAAEGKVSEKKDGGVGRAFAPLPSLYFRLPFLALPQLTERLEQASLHVVQGLAKKRKLCLPSGGAELHEAVQRCAVLVSGTF